MTDPLAGGRFHRREARLLDAARPHYPTVLEGWHEELLVASGGTVVWMPTTFNRPLAIPVHCLERRVVVIP